MKKYLILAAVASALLLGGDGEANANLIVNGDFESEPNFGFGVQNGVQWSAFSGTQIPGWTIAPGHLATIHASPNPTISGQYSLNTDGEGGNGNNALIYQDFTSSAGASYQLQFDWESWIDNAPATQLEVSVFDTTTSAVVFDGLYSYSGQLVVHHVSNSFMGTGDTLRLQIQETPQSRFNDNMFIVDNFSVDPNASAVPEPASLTLLGISAFGLAGYGWRRRKAALAV